MRRLLAVIVGGAAIAVTLGSSAPAFASTGKVKGDTVNYTYKKTTSEDSSTCGGGWATDTDNRVYQVYPEQANNGTYVVHVTFKGKFETLAAQSPESCEAGTANDIAPYVKGKFHGYTTIYVSNADISGPFDPATDVSCSATCSTTEWVANAFGAGATYTTPDWWFKYTTTDPTACASKWINANYGNSGDIATTCDAGA
jgi:hypothetical protein